MHKPIAEQLTADGHRVFDTSELGGGLGDVLVYVSEWALWIPLELKSGNAVRKERVADAGRTPAQTQLLADGIIIPTAETIDEARACLIEARERAIVALLGGRPYIRRDNRSC